MSEDAKKWSCPRCTYENWPRSRRCTLCAASRNLSSIPETEEPSSHAESGGNAKLMTGGWSCPSCTFDNWAASARCAQCGTASPNAPKAPSDASTAPSASLSSLGVVKWTCQSCTYENWPKSKRCIMCKAPQSPAPTNSPPSRSSSSASPSVDWLVACKAVVTGDPEVLQKFLLTPESQNLLATRTLGPQDCQALEKWFSSADSPVIKPGLSLLDLARAFNRHEWVSSLSALCSTSGVGGNKPTPKRSVCQVSASAAKELRCVLDGCVRQRRGSFHCSYITEFSTFFLPAEVRALPAPIQELMMKELCDTEVQKELEVRSQAINWWVVDGQVHQSTSRLFALWNRTDGDCLLDSLMQACWGVFDQQSTLRHALSESITACEKQFFRVWREYEVQQAANQYMPDEEQLIRDWHSALKAASLTRSPLEQIHIFVLAHVLRRPIIVYSVKFINNYRDEPIGLANFQGVYLPLLWESNFCFRDPVILGYTRGHFTALVPFEPPRSPSPTDSPPTVDKLASPSQTNTTATTNTTTAAPATSSVASAESPTSVTAPSDAVDAAEECASVETSEPRSETSVYLPLFDRHGTPFHVPFAHSNNSKAYSDNQLLRDRLATISTRRGLLLARMRLPSRRQPLVEEIVKDWLLAYRRTANTTTTTTTSTASVSSSVSGTGAFSEKVPLE